MKKYTIDGKEVEIVKEIEGGFLVKEVLEYYQPDWDEEDEPNEGDQIVGEQILFFEKLYDEPLVAKHADKIKQLEKDAEKLNNEISELQATKRNEESLLSKVSKYPFVQTMVDYLIGDFNFLLDMKDFGVKKKDQSFNTNYIKVTNTKSNGWGIYKLRNDNYDSSDDTPFRVFKTMDDLTEFSRKHLTSALEVYSCNYNRASNFKEWFSRIDYSNPTKKEPEFITLYNEKYNRLVEEDKAETAKNVQKKIDELEEQKKKLQTT